MNRINTRELIGVIGILMWFFIFKQTVQTLPILLMWYIGIFWVIPNRHTITDFLFGGKE